MVDRKRFGCFVLTVLVALVVIDAEGVQAQLFAPPVSYSAEAPPRPVAADLNRDGIADLVIRTSRGFAVWLAKGDGTFHQPNEVLTSNYGGISVGDYNSDGKLDIAVGASFVDANGDGKLDLMIAGTRQTACGPGSCQDTYNLPAVTLFPGNGDGTFAPPVAPGTALGSTTQAPEPAVDSIRPRSAYTTSVMGLRLGSGDGTFQPFKEIVGMSAWEFLQSIATADLDRDGKLDFVVASAPPSAARVDVLRGKGDGTLGSAFSIGLQVSSAFVSVIPADFDGDGYPELAVLKTPYSNQSGGTYQQAENLAIYHYVQSWQFLSTVSYPTSQAYAAATGDVNGDGKQDVIVADKYAGAIGVFLGKGDGTFDPELHYAVGQTPAGLTAADLNGDHKTDLIVTYPDAHGVETNSFDVLLASGGTAAEGVPVLDVPHSLSLTALLDGSLASTSFKVANKGNWPLSVFSISVAGADFAATNDCTHRLLTGETCNVNVTFAPKKAGPQSATLAVSSNATGSPYLIGLAGKAVDLAIAASRPGSDTASISAGQAANFALTISSAQGSAETVSFTCGGAPLHASCSVSPGSFGFDNQSTSTQINISVVTTAPSQASKGAAVLGVGSSALCLVIGLIIFPCGPRRTRIPIALVLIVVTALFTSCGGGNTRAPQSTPGTPAGNYTIVVTATSGNLSRSMNLSLLIR